MPLRQPIRVVHLLEIVRGGHDGILACAAACRLPAVEHHVWLLGSAADEAACAALGLAVTDRVTPPLNRAPLARHALERLHGNRIRAWGRPADAVVAWSHAAHDATPGSLRRVPRRATVLPIPVAPARPIGDALLLTLGPAARAHTLSEAGLLTRALPLPVAPPPVAPPPGGPAHRAHLRAALGLEPGDLAVLLLGDPPTAADGRWFASVVGMTQLAGARAVGIVPAMAAQARRGFEFGRLHGRFWESVASDLPPSQLLPAADVACWSIGCTHPGRQPGLREGGVALAAAALACGVPVVAPPHPLARALLAEEPAAIARAARVPDVVQCLLPFADDRAHLRIVSARLAARWRPRADPAFALALGRELRLPAAIPRSPSPEPAAAPAAPAATAQ